MFERSSFQESLSAYLSWWLKCIFFIKKNNKTQADFQFLSLYRNTRLSIIPTRFDISNIVSSPDKYILTIRQSYLTTDKSWNNLAMNKNESCKRACLLLISLNWLMESTSNFWRIVSEDLWAFVVDTGCLFFCFIWLFSL